MLFIFARNNTLAFAVKVEVHDDDWWMVRFEAAGFVYSQHLTTDARRLASGDSALDNLTLQMEKGKRYNVAQHLRLNVQVCSKILYFVM